MPQEIISDTAGLYKWTHRETWILASKKPGEFSVGFPWQTCSLSSCQHGLFLLSSNSLTSNLPWMLTTALALGLAPMYWLQQSSLRSFHVPFQTGRVHKISLSFVQHWDSMHFHFSLGLATRRLANEHNSSHTISKVQQETGSGKA